jgi:hypothetical protein
VDHGRSYPVNWRALLFVHSSQPACLRTSSLKRLSPLSKERFKRLSCPYHQRVARSWPMVRPTVPVTNLRKSLRTRSTTALLQDNALNGGVSARRGSNTAGQTSGGTCQVSSQSLIPRPPTKRRRRGYHLIEKMGLDKNKPDEHMKYKRIQVCDPDDACMCSSDLPTTLVRQKDVREQSQRILDQNKTFGNQPAGLVDQLKRTVRRSCCPCF